MLTIINEKIFRNEQKNEKVPLKGLVAASNELPQKGQSLEALYDRFIMRLVVSRLSDKEHFKTLLGTQSVSEKVAIPDNLCFSNDEVEAIKKNAAKVIIEENVINAIMLLRDRIAAYNDKATQNNEPIIDVSERRWVAIMELLRVAAILSDRQSVKLADLSLLRHCLWSEESHKIAIANMLEESLKISSPQFVSDESMYNRLKQEIAQILTHTKDVYDAVVIGGEEYIKFNAKVKKE